MLKTLQVAQPQHGTLPAGALASTVTTVVARLRISAKARPSTSLRIFEAFTSMAALPALHGVKPKLNAYIKLPDRW
jgi:hypothetical protein